jgi:hypothetical protein
LVSKPFHPLKKSDQPFVPSRFKSFLLILQLSLQYLTSDQYFSHFLRQVNGFKQTTHVLKGRFSFLTEFGMKGTFGDSERKQLSFTDFVECDVFLHRGFKAKLISINKFSMFSAHSTVYPLPP